MSKAKGRKYISSLTLILMVALSFLIYSGSYEIENESIRHDIRLAELNVMEDAYIVDVLMDEYNFNITYALDEIQNFKEGDIVSDVIQQIYNNNTHSRFLNSIQRIKIRERTSLLKYSRNKLYIIVVQVLILIYTFITMALVQNNLRW